MKNLGDWDLQFLWVVEVSGNVDWRRSDGLILQLRLIALLCSLINNEVYDMFYLDWFSYTDYLIYA